MKYFTRYWYPLNGASRRDFIPRNFTGVLLWRSEEGGPLIDAEMYLNGEYDIENQMNARSNIGGTEDYPRLYRILKGTEYEEEMLSVILGEK